MASRRGMWGGFRSGSSRALPVLEAAGWGKKIVTSRLEVFSEIGVPARFQIDFSDPDQLLAALRLPGPTVLEKRPHGWEECARATLRELRRAAQMRDDGRAV